MDNRNAYTRRPDGNASAVATLFGIQDLLGTIAPGKLAGLILLNADPLVNSRKYSAHRSGVANGRLMKRGKAVRRKTNATRPANLPYG